MPSKKQCSGFVISLLSLCFSTTIFAKVAPDVSNEDLDVKEEINSPVQTQEALVSNQDNPSQEEALEVVMVDGDYICSDMNGISEFRGVEGKNNKLFLTEDVKIDHSVSFSHVTIIGDIVESRSGNKTGKRFGLETINGGEVHFGSSVTLQNCLIRNLKQKSQASKQNN